MQQGDIDMAQMERCGDGGEVGRYIVQPVRGRGGRCGGGSGNI